MPLIPNPGEYIPLVESMLWLTANYSQLFIADIYIKNQYYKLYNVTGMTINCQRWGMLGCP